MIGWKINLKKLGKTIKEYVLCSLIFITVVMILFFAVVGLESWSRGFVW